MTPSWSLLLSPNQRFVEPSGRGPKYDLLHPDEGMLKQDRHRSQRTSWWRNIYNRISQSEPDPIPSNLLPHPNASNLSAPSKKDRSSYHKPSRVYDYNYDFEDPPPPSAIRTYKAKKAGRGDPGKPQDRRQSLLSGLAAPNLRDDIHYVPSASPTTVALARLSPDSRSRSPPRTSYPPNNIPLSTPSVPPQPLQTLQTTSFTSLVSLPTTELSHPDSVLARVFPYRSDASHSGEALSSSTSFPAAPSSQSHQSRLKLAGDRRVVTNAAVYAQNPNLSTPLWTERPVIRSHEGVVGEIPRDSAARPVEDHRIDHMRDTPIATTPNTTTPVPKSTRSKHLRDSALYKARLIEAEPYSRYPIDQPLARLPKPGKYRPERLVMPTPLVNSQPSSSTARPSASSSPLPPVQLTTSPTTYSPNEDTPIGKPSSSPLSSSPDVPLASRSHRHSRRPADILPTPRFAQPLTPTVPPKLRRSTYNVKRHSYTPEQHHSSSTPRGRQDRRVSAPIDTIPESSRGHANPYLARKPPPGSELYTK